MTTGLPAISAEYRANGVVGGVPVLTTDEAQIHRSALEHTESEIGSLHYIDKVHTALTSPMTLVTHPRVLDVVEALIGPDILLYNSTFIIKEPHTDSFVAWHQDLTYWGLADDDAQVSMWLALSPASEQSGCMSMLPGSHVHGRIDHVESNGEANLLLLGQHITDVDATTATMYPLQPGEASSHHGWTVHQSAPNLSNDRRIGLNVQYLAPHNAHRGGGGTAMLVRGEDRFGYFGIDEPATSDLEPRAVERWRELDRQMKEGSRRSENHLLRKSSR